MPSKSALIHAIAQGGKLRDIADELECSENEANGLIYAVFGNGLYQARLQVCSMLVRDLDRLQVKGTPLKLPWSKEESQTNLCQWDEC